MESVMKDPDLPTPPDAARHSEAEGTPRPFRNRMDMADLTGKPALPFRLADSGGRTHRLEDYRGSWLLMVFHRHLG